MSFVTLLSTFIIAWFLVFLMVLPWGNQLSPPGSLGAASGAPLHPRLPSKIFLTTGISLLIVGIFAYFQPLALLLNV